MKLHNKSLCTIVVLIAVGQMLGSCSEDVVPTTALMEIPYVTVETQDVSIPVDVIGETMGSTDVSIRARVEGFIDGIHFAEGTYLEKETLLYTIDPEPFMAGVAQAKAMMAEAHTSLAKAKSDLARIRPLAEINAVSAQDLDAAIAGYEAAQSYVEATKAQVDLANIKLGYTKIYAPVGGLIGLSESEVGDFVSQSNNGGLLNVISSTDPIAVRVSINERGYLIVARRLAERQKHMPTDSEGQSKQKEPSLQLILADGTFYEHLGMPTKVDRAINASTGSLTIEAEFPNPDKFLRPGMFARIRFDAADIPDAILLPQRAVTQLQSVNRVFVIRPDDTVEVRQVQVGTALGSNWVIESGLEAGERVAVAGLLRLRPELKVSPRPAGIDDLPATASNGATDG